MTNSSPLTISGRTWARLKTSPLTPYISQKKHLFFSSVCFNELFIVIKCGGGQDIAANHDCTYSDSILTQCHECEMTAFISMLYKWRDWRLTQSISKSVTVI